MNLYNQIKTLVSRQPQNLPASTLAELRRSQEKPDYHSPYEPVFQNGVCVGITDGVGTHAQYRAALMHELTKPHIILEGRASEIEIEDWGWTMLSDVVSGQR